MSTPTGFIRPVNEHAARALRAIQERRFEDARQNLGAAPRQSLMDRLWQGTLAGLLATEQGAFASAEPLLLEAAGLGSILLHTDNAADTAAWRVLALVLEPLGRIYRRRELPDDARTIHAAAYRLRCAHGSPEEMWESACSLGLDSDLARRFDEAQQWYRSALGHADACVEQPDAKRGVAWRHLAESLLECGNPGPAVDAARNSRQCWRRHDLAASTVPLADLTLARALLRRGERLCGGADANARHWLDEAMQLLSAAHDALLAFGPAHAADARTCAELHEFGERLRAQQVTP
ncbi:MAG: hypothetical protein HY763_06350 [Planctomycetes bacterium]|nr:hypothetical protein [Planctomycetota bacterium]